MAVGRCSGELRVQAALCKRGDFGPTEPSRMVEMRKGDKETGEREGKPKEG